MTSYSVTRTSNLDRKTSKVEFRWNWITFVILTHKVSTDFSRKMQKRNWIGKVQNKSKWYVNFLGMFPKKTKSCQISEMQTLQPKILGREWPYLTKLFPEIQTRIESAPCLENFYTKNKCHPSYINYVHIKAGKIPHVSVQNDYKDNNRIANQVSAHENGEHRSYSNLCWFWIRVQRHRGDVFSVGDQ